MSISAIQLDSILCNSKHGCPKWFDATPVGCCYSDETRRQARAEGWVTGVQQAWSSQTRHLPRLDFCPEHANEGRS